MAQQKIEEYIKEVFRQRLGRKGVLVVYDAAKRYRAIAASFAGGETAFVDASESSIESREAALEAFVRIGKPGSRLKQLVVYVPAARPLTDEARQQDPFAAFAEAGDVFPWNAGDEYKSLCLKFKPDQTTEILRLFAQDPPREPEFAVIDAVGGSTGWPTLKSELTVDSSRELLLAILAPTDAQKANLQKGDAWVEEAKDLFVTTLRLKLKTKGRTWSSLSTELWRYLLFSEFAFDLPAGTLPEALANIPRAPEEAKTLVYDLCDQLRDSQTNRVVYIEQAESVETELNLVATCAGLADLGSRDTFPFEERQYFAKAVAALQAQDFDGLQRLFEGHRGQVWSHRGENLAQWQLLESAAALVRACDDVQRELPTRVASQAAFLEFYETRLFEVDRLQREFEQATCDLIVLPEELDAVLPSIRARYRKFAGTVQDVFLKQIETTGWPPQGRLANIEVFDKKIAPLLQESNHKVALILVDALRYELGVELKKLLAKDHQVELIPAYAALPSITSVGMACFLPGASTELALKKKTDGFVVAHGAAELPQVTQRLAVLKNRYGTRFAESTLADYLKPKAKVPSTAELFLLRTTDLDAEMENATSMSLKVLHDVLRQLGAAVAKLGKAGFREVFLVADHGFFLNTAREAGDVCMKPAGAWVSVHDRLLLGTGSSDGANLVLSAQQLGIRGDFPQVATPRAIVPYKAGQWYFHGGISLQETVVPVIHVTLDAGAREEQKMPKVFLSYKQGSTKVTTRLPMISVAMEGELFGSETVYDVLLLAHNHAGDVVGEAKMGGPVDPATGLLHLKPSDSFNIPLRMDMAFEGKFTVKVLDPVTDVLACKLELETDYAV